MKFASCFCALFCVIVAAAPAPARPLKVLVFGDSLSSGFDLPDGAAFPNALSRRLAARGHRDVDVYNASEAGDSTADAVKRLPRALEHGADLVIVQLGGNDMLMSEEPRNVYANLSNIVRYSKARGARVLISGMLSLPKRDPTYKRRFETVYPSVAAGQGASLYPFALDGVFGDARLMQRDGKHPNVYGAARMAAGITPLVERELDALRQGRGPEW